MLDRIYTIAALNLIEKMNKCKRQYSRRHQKNYLSEEKATSGKVLSEIDCAEISKQTNWAAHQENKKNVRNTINRPQNSEGLIRRRLSASDGSSPRARVSERERERRKNAPHSRRFMAGVEGTRWLLIACFQPSDCFAAKLDPIK